jgi:hypothetical protein
LESDKKPRQLAPTEIAGAVSDLKQQLAAASQGPVQRIDCSPESVEQGLAKLVLSLIELLRRLLERQAIRRMQGGRLTEQQVEDMGQALMKLEQKIAELAAAFGLKPEDLDLDLGPLGRLLND